MAFGDTIQTAENTSSLSATVVVTFSAAVAGNLLVAVVGSSNTTSQVWVTPSGWTLIHDSGTTGNMGGAAYWKIAAGGETTVTLDHTGTSGNLGAVMAEFEGPFAASPADQAAEDAANISTVVTSQTSGTTGTTTQADELAVACWAADSAGNVDATRAYTNSFAEVAFQDVSVGRAGAILAKKILAATGTVECTFSCIDTGDEMYGAVATFKKASAAAAKISNMCLMGVG